MKLLYLLLCASFGSSFYIDNNATSKAKIIGGSREEIANIPYQATLEYFGTLLCGAIILSKDWLLSAAHCFVDLNKPLENVKVRAGTSEREKGGRVFDLNEIIIHEDFDESNFEADIVLLGASIEFDEQINYIPLAQKNSYPEKGSKMIISGFGKVHENCVDMSPVLKKAEVKVVPRVMCPRDVKYIKRVFCATSYPDDHCYGDSGGPGVIGDRLAAIITGGVRCGDEYTSSVHMNVGAFFSWIMKKARKTLDAYQISLNITSVLSNLEIS